MKQLLAALGSGMVFGLGLVVSQMADPQVVLSFLTLDAGWNPALMLVMGAAVTVTFIGYRLIFARGKPLYAAEFRLHRGNRSRLHHGLRPVTYKLRSPA